MKSHNEESPVVIFAGTMVEAGFVKSMLDDAEIESYFKDDLMGTIAPFYTTVGGLDAVKIVVAQQDVERALLVVKDFEANN